jgi:hypothetical protein
MPHSAVLARKTDGAACAWQAVPTRADACRIEELRSACRAKGRRRRVRALDPSGRLSPGCSGKNETTVTPGCGAGMSVSGCFALPAQNR